MKNYARIGALILLLFIFLCPGITGAEEVETAPDFSLADTNNNIVTLSSYKDKQPALLFFWTTWCPYCRGELKVLNEKCPKLIKDGLRVLSVNVGESSNKVKNFIQGYNLACPVILDKSTATANNYKIIGVPTYILINKKGNVVFRGNRFDAEEYKDLISE